MSISPNLVASLSSSFVIHHESSGGSPPSPTRTLLPCTQRGPERAYDSHRCPEANPLSFFLLLHHSRLPDEAELTVSAILDAGEDLATALTPRWFQPMRKTTTSRMVPSDPHPVAKSPTPASLRQVSGDLAIKA